MRELSLEFCYRTLGITNADTFESARKAFKQKMHRCHPDRYPNDPIAQEKATDRFMEVKRCFRVIEEYYVMYGEMPYVEFSNPAPKTESRTNKIIDDTSPHRAHRHSGVFKKYAGAERSGDHGRVGKSTRMKFHQENKARFSVTERNISAAEIGAGLFVVGILAYFILQSPMQKLLQADSEVSEKQIDEEITDLDARPKPEMPLTKEERISRGLLTKSQVRLDEATNGQTFTFGSSLDEVAAIHGVPDRAEPGIWFYDKSRIMYKDGRVVEWKSDPSFPLATRLK